MFVRSAHRAGLLTWLVTAALTTSVAFVDAATAAPPDGTFAWIDSPLSGAVVEAGSVPVQAHGDGAGEPMQLLVDGSVVAAQAASDSDGRLSATTLSWPATTGVHQLTVRIGGLFSAVAVVHVVSAAGPPTDGPPAGPPAGGSSGSAPPSASPSVPDSTPPIPSSGQSGGPPSSSAPSAGTSSSDPGSSSAPPASSSPPGSATSSPPHLHLVPSISAVSADPTTINAGTCGKTPPLAVAVHVTGATSVVAQFVDVSGVRLQVPLADTGGLWTVTVYPGALPATGHQYGLWIQATGPGGTARAFGTGIFVATCIPPIH